jgi:hypothetical protein
MAPRLYLTIARQAVFPSFFQVVELIKVTMYYMETEVIMWWLVVESFFLIIFFCQKMSDSGVVREKRLSVGARVSGTFGDFYPNPDPNVKRRKRQRIYGVVQEACGPRKYKICFDSGLIVDCFSNTLRLEKSSASVPADVLASAVCHNTAIEEQVLVEENEAAANDIDMEEHLPDSPEEDSDDDGIDFVGEHEEDTSEEQRPVGVLNGETVDEPTTYAGRKEATNKRIAELLGKTKHSSG